MPEYFTPLTLDLQTGVVSTEDTVEIWESAREVAIEKVRGRANRSTRADSPMVDRELPGHVGGGGEAARSHPNGSSGPGGRPRMGGRGRSAGRRASRSVKEKEWLKTLKIFGVGKEDGKRINGRLGYTLLNEHEKLFGSYWRHTLGHPVVCRSCLGKACRSVPPSPQGG